MAMIAVVALSAVLAFWRGFTVEVLALGSLLGALIIAGQMGGLVEPLIVGWLPSERGALLVAYILVFVLSLVVESIISRIISRQVRKSTLSSVDRTLGMLFGIARGGLLIVACFIAMSWLTPLDDWPGLFRTARLLPVVERGAEAVSELLPERYRVQLVQHAAPGSAPPR